MTCHITQPQHAAAGAGADGASASSGSSSGSTSGSAPSSAPPHSMALCYNDCKWPTTNPVSQASNSLCQDGGAGAEYSMCPLGHDCADVRAPSPVEGDALALRFAHARVPACPRDLKHALTL